MSHERPTGKPLASCRGAVTRVAAFIDGANLYPAAKATGRDIDFRLLKSWLGGERAGEVPPHDPSWRLLRAAYYTALVESDDGEFQSIRPLIDWLSYNGFSMRSKPARPYIDAVGQRRVKGNIDVDLAVDAMAMAATGRCDDMVLFSGDGDFVPLVREVQRAGVRVIVVSALKVHPPMVADELRRQADEFICLSDLIKIVGRDPAARASRDAKG